MDDFEEMGKGIFLKGNVMVFLDASPYLVAVDGIAKIATTNKELAIKTARHLAEDQE